MPKRQPQFGFSSRFRLVPHPFLGALPSFHYPGNRNAVDSVLPRVLSSKIFLFQICKSHQLNLKIYKSFHSRINC